MSKKPCCLSLPLLPGGMGVAFGPVLLGSRMGLVLLLLFFLSDSFNGKISHWHREGFKHFVSY